MENIPAVVFDLMQEKSFAELSAGEQALVLQWLSAEAYDRLRTLGRDVTIALREDQHAPDARLLDTLTTTFRSRRRKPVNPFALKVPVWQAAAVALLLAGAGLLFLKAPEAGIALLPVHDTVYIAAKAPEKEIIRDTIYISWKQGGHYTTGNMPAQPGRRKERTAAVGAPITGKPQPAAVRTDIPGQLQVLPIAQKDEPPNTVAAKNMEEDSLLERFGFVHF